MKNEKQKDYSKYAFKKTAKLEISPMFLDDINRFLSEIVSQNGMGSYYLTEPRFEYVDIETSKPKKPTKSNQDKIKKVFSWEKTMDAEPVQHLTPLGKQAMALMAIVNEVKTENIDLGNGSLIEDLRREAEANVAAEQMLEIQPESDAEETLSE